MNEAVILKLVEINRLESEVIDELAMELLKHISAQEFESMPAAEKMRAIAEWQAREE